MQALRALAGPDDPCVQRAEDHLGAHHRLDVGQNGGVIDDRQEHGVERHEVGEVTGRAAVAVLDADLEHLLDDEIAHPSGFGRIEDVGDHREAPDLKFVETVGVDAGIVAVHRSSSGCFHCATTPASTSLVVRSSS